MNNATTKTYAVNEFVALKHLYSGNIEYTGYIERETKTLWIVRLTHSVWKTQRKTYSIRKSDNHATTTHNVYMVKFDENARLFETKFSNKLEKEEKTCKCGTTFYVNESLNGFDINLCDECYVQSIENETALKTVTQQSTEKLKSANAEIDTAIFKILTDRIAELETKLLNRATSHNDELAKVAKMVELKNETIKALTREAKMLRDMIERQGTIIGEKMQQIEALETTSKETNLVEMVKQYSYSAENVGELGKLAMTALDNLSTTSQINVLSDMYSTRPGFENFIYQLTMKCNSRYSAKK